MKHRRLAAIVATAFLSACSPAERSPDPAATARMAARDPVAGADPVSRGRYLAAAGDCTGCHRSPDGDGYAGGLAIPTPYGSIPVPNITPDRDTGIGAWTADDFWRALHDGRGKDGRYLYPAFPFPNYTRVTRDDSDALYAYLRSLPPARREPQPNDLRFPFDLRPLLAVWRALYFDRGVFEIDPRRDAEWNRGAYLASGLGHCVACHSPRTFLGGIRRQDELSGGLIAVQNWVAPSLTSDPRHGLGDRPVDELVQLLKHGVSDRHAVFGPMAEVVHDSTQHLAEADLRAMAVYLKSLPPRVSADAPPMPTSEAQRTESIEAGERLYVRECADCHGRDGEGVPRVYPALARNASVIMDSGINPIRVVLHGGFPPVTGGNLRPYGMPPFAQRLSDGDIAAVLTYVRTSWGNAAPALAPGDVQRYRSVPIE